MTRKNSYLVVFFMAFIAIASCFVIYNQRTDEEGQVYLAFLSSYRDKAHDVAFLSEPTDCDGVSAVDMPELSAELFASYLAANNEEARPVDLHTLYGYFNVVSYEDAKRIRRDLGWKHRPANKRLVTLSRVGFDAASAQALFCVDFDDSGHLVYLVKVGANWTVVKTKNVWIS